MSADQLTIDVSRLPTTVFGHRTLTWWGTLGFIVIEGLMFAVASVSYFYLWRNFPEWPPAHTPLPSLTIPTINLLLILGSFGIAVWIDKAAKRYDRESVMVALWVAVLAGLAILVLRAFEFGALNTRWDANAYGSLVWVILGFHTTHMLLDVVESAAQAVLMTTGPVEPKHFVDASDGALYWKFVVLSWPPLYAIVFLAPRWI